jgi:hypothetical protein
MSFKKLLFPQVSWKILFNRIVAVKAAQVTRTGCVLPVAKLDVEDMPKDIT